MKAGKLGLLDQLLVVGIFVGGVDATLRLPGLGHAGSRENRVAAYARRLRRALRQVARAGRHVFVKLVDAGAKVAEILLGGVDGARAGDNIVGAHGAARRVRQRARAAPRRQTAR